MTEDFKIGSVADFEDRSRILVEIEGREIAVFRVGDSFHAVANFCVHQSGPLCEGELTGQMCVADNGWDWVYDDEEKIITCPWHGWRFDVTTGENVQDDRYRTPTYDVEVRDEDVFIKR